MPNQDIPAGRSKSSQKVAYHFKKCFRLLQIGDMTSMRNNHHLSTRDFGCIFSCYLRWDNCIQLSYYYQRREWNSRQQMSQISSLCHTARSCGNPTRCCRGYHPPDPRLHFWMVPTSIIRDQLGYLEICDCAISPCLGQTRYTFAIDFGLFCISSRSGICQDQTTQALWILMQKCQCCISPHREATENCLPHA